MGIIDIVFICIIALGFISGLQKGLLASFLACIAMAGAWFIALGTYMNLAELLNGSRLQDWVVKFDVTDAASLSRIFGSVSFTAIFFIAYSALLLIVNLFNNVFRFPQIRVFDGFLGGIMGIGRAALLVLVAVSALQIVFGSVDMAEFVNTLLDGSVSGEIIKDINIINGII